MKILIVDDEPLVRKGLFSLLSQHTCVTEISEAGNGETAFEMICSDPPDVVLTDVIMPGLDGIGLLKKIVAFYPQILTVVLSSHQDFKYVKQAFVFGAQDYLLKYDIEDSVFFTMLDDFDEKLKTARSTATEKEQQIRSLFNGDLPPETRIAAVCLSHFGKKHLIPDGFDFPVKHYSVPENTFLLCAAEHSEELANACLRAYGGSAGMSGEGSPESSDELCSQARRAYEMRFFCGSEQLFKFTEGCGDVPLSPFVLELKKRLTAEILGFGLSQTLRLLEQLLQKLKSEPNFSVIQVRLLYVSLAELLFIKHDSTFSEQGLAVHSIDRNIMEAETLDSIAEIFDKLFQMIINSSLHIIDFHDCSELVKNCAAYINTHFGNGALNLEMIATSFGYTAPYLSRVFKNETGVNVVDYINELRILTAKNMLKAGNKHVYEVAQAVGYNNYNYFSKIFKRIASCSPTDYISRLT